MPNHAMDLEKHPLFMARKQNEAPVSVGMGHLTVTEGARLEEMTRITSPQQITAHAIGYVYVNIYGSKYVRGRISQNDRLAEAKDGLRSQELINMVQAGGALPSEYYAPGSKTPNYQIITNGGQDD